MKDIYTISNDALNKAYADGFAYGYKNDLKLYDVVKHTIDLIRGAANFPITDLDGRNFYEEIFKIVKRYYLPHLPRGNFLREEGALKAALQHQLIFIGEQTQ